MSHPRSNPGKHLHKGRGYVPESIVPKKASAKPAGKTASTQEARQMEKLVRVVTVEHLN